MADIVPVPKRDRHLRQVVDGLLARGEWPPVDPVPFWERSRGAGPVTQTIEERQRFARVEEIKAELLDLYDARDESGGGKDWRRWKKKLARIDTRIERLRDEAVLLDPKCRDALDRMACVSASWRRPELGVRREDRAAAGLCRDCARPSDGARRCSRCISRRGSERATRTGLRTRRGKK